MNNMEPEKKDVWAEFDEATKCYDIASSVRPLLRAVILTHFLSKSELREKIEAKQNLFNFIPQDEYGYKMVKTRDLDLLDLLTQEK